LELGFWQNMRSIFYPLLLCDLQEVAVKEQLMGKGKLYRRSLSSPNVNRVSIPCWSLQQIEGSKCIFQLPIEYSNKFPFA